MTSLSLVSWALNEEENVDLFLDKAERFASGLTNEFEVIVIDDGSTDSTWFLLQRAASERPWLKILQNEGNLGVGYCTKKAIAAARMERVLWQTQDWSYDLDWFAHHWNLVDQDTIIHGSRMLASRGNANSNGRSDTKFKALVSFGNLILVKLLFALPYSDVQNVTLYPTKTAQSFRLKSSSSFTNPECLIWAWRIGSTILEVPVGFIPRSAGVAKGTRPKAIIKAVRDIFAFRFSAQPKREGASYLMRWPNGES